MKVCAEPGCPELTNTTRCPAHMKQKRRAEDKRRPNARQRGYDARWQQTRAQYLQAFPICQWPDGCLNPATDVHHRDGHGPRGDRGHDFSNLQGLCHAHHSKVTAREQAAGWNR